jgi:DNA uptake protein ComE-like DNA-binding protein
VTPRVPRAPRRAVILPIVLVLIGLLTLTLGTFVFFVRTESAGMRAALDGQQARLAALSGFDEVALLLRVAADRHDFTQWYNVPTRFQHALVWSAAYDRTGDPVRQARTRPEALEAFGGAPPVAWRYSVVAAEYDQTDESFRYGITPESGKLNLNTATDAQLEQLLTPLLADLGVENAPELIAALLDWRDADEDVRDGGAEAEYYATLTPPYRPKNGVFDTVEELLLVRGFTAAILWGEDTNRNGLLDPNEDDGDATFPDYDNGDALLNHGIAPFLTVWSREPDAALDNKPRINLNANSAVVMAQIGTDIEEGQLSDATIGFLAGLAGRPDVRQLRSVADLYAGEEPDDELPAMVRNSPVQREELPVLLDRFSVRPADQAGEPLRGLINLNTAPRRVLLLVPGMTPETADALIAGRGGDAERRRTPAWPITDEVLDAATFRAIAPYLTTKAYQFHVEIVAYGDHTRLSRRYEWIIEMVGPVAQVKFERELTALGSAWPVDRDLTTVVGSR